MISEAIGKILGMAMAYGVSSLGLFRAYVNYRRRIVGADKVMTPAAWGVLAAVALGVAAGVAVVWQLAEPPATVVEEAAPAAAPPVVEAVAAPADDEPRDRWPLIGILVPAAIFLFATWVTAGLYSHFTHHGHGGPQPNATEDDRLLS